MIIPTSNAGAYIDTLLDSLSGQSADIAEVIVVDSASEDDTLQRLADHPAVRVLNIRRTDFDHGGTRDMALRQSIGDVVVFLTQDALPGGCDSIENLIRPLLQDERIAAVGGRQIAREDAPEYEKLVRAHNYPAQSRVWSAAEIDVMGIRAFMISDVFAAYRREAYEAVGGFDHPLLTNEDMLIAEKFLHAGYRLAYAADACVLHSHNHTLRQEYDRNFLIGTVLEKNKSRFHNAGDTGEGVSLVLDVAKGLLRRGRFLQLIGFGCNCAARLLGNRNGRRSSRRMPEKAD